MVALIKLLIVALVIALIPGEWISITLGNIRIQLSGAGFAAIGLFAARAGDVMANLSFDAVDRVRTYQEFGNTETWKREYAKSLWD